MVAMDDLVGHLSSLQGLKPPGVTKSKIDAITAICVQNIQFEDTIVQKLHHYFSSSPATHKLGVIYVLDSVTRQWVEKAKVSGQAVSRNPAPGTFAAGVQKVTSILPSLMTDLIQSAPDNQKDKISKLLDIWERSQTFPSQLLAQFKQQLNAPKNDTYTPPGSPPKTVPAPAGGLQANAQPMTQSAPVPAPPADPAALLAALAQMTQTQANPAPAAPAVAPPMPFAQGMGPPPPPPGFFPPQPAAVVAPPAIPAPPAMPPAAGNDMLAQIVTLYQAGLIPQDQFMTILSAVAAQQQQQQQQPQQQPQPQLQPQQLLQQQPGAATLVPQFPPSLPQPPVTANPPPVAQPDRYDQNGSRYRDRSRSPEYNRHSQSPDRRTPPNRRNSPTYGVYDPGARSEGSGHGQAERERGRGRGKNKGRGGRDDYRQRTPPGQRRQRSPPRNDESQQKFIEWDHSLPRDHIRVLSRTLFVGGAGGTENEIRSIFSRFGKVQTCIVNQDKRHAFVKMVNRQDALNAKQGMDNLQDQQALSKARQTRWGVGFGPRDCSDYTTGISVIPISRLTDADRKWVTTAEYGGTGGRPLEGGMVIEEPDIEIGAGVSSKAISRRVPPEGGRGRGGHQHGGHGGRGGFDNGPGRFRKHDRPAQDNQPRHTSPRNPDASVGVPPAVPGFGFQLPGF